jgi:hypothetical protein
MGGVVRLRMLQCGRVVDVDDRTVISRCRRTCWLVKSSVMLVCTHCGEKG